MIVKIQYGPITTGCPRPPIVRSGRRLTWGVLGAVHNPASFGISDRKLARASGRSPEAVKRHRLKYSEELANLPIEAEERLMQLITDAAAAKGFDGSTICAKVHGDCFPREDPADVRNTLGWFMDSITS